MSRSRKKHPAGGITLAESEQQDKTIAARQIRRRVKQDVQALDEDYIPRATGYSNPYKWAKDGKRWFQSETVERHPYIMRK